MKSVAALAVVVAVASAGCGVASSTAAPSGGGDRTDQVPVEALPDGELFGFVTFESTPVDERVVLMVDVAELLSGTEAHDAATTTNLLNFTESCQDNF